MTSFVTIVIPAYNAADTIRRCVSSILDHNSCRPEVIIVNDGSSDSTMSELQGLVDIYGSSIKVLSQLNGGPVLARRAGLLLSTREYLVTVDADDTLLPGAVDRLESAIESSGKPDLIIFNGIREFSSKPMWVYPLRSNELVSPAEMLKLRGLFIDSAMFNNFVLKAFHRSIYDFERDYSFAAGFCHGEDALQVLPLIDKASTIFHYDEILYLYTHNASSVTNSGNIRYLNDSKIYRKELSRVAKGWSLDHVQERINSKFLRSVFRICHGLARSGSLSREILRNIESDEDVVACLAKFSTVHLSPRQRFFRWLLSTRQYFLIIVYFHFEIYVGKLARDLGLR